MRASRYALWSFERAPHYTKIWYRFARVAGEPISPIDTFQHLVYQPALCRATSLRSHTKNLLCWVPRVFDKGADALSIAPNRRISVLMRSGTVGRRRSVVDARWRIAH